MSKLFETITDMSNGYNDTLDSGSYTFKNPRKGNPICGAPSCGCTTAEQCELNKPTEPEPAPSVSLYNLLDHSDADLDFLLDCAKKREEELRPMKLALNESYMKAVSWMTIISGAIREKNETSK